MEINIEQIKILLDLNIPNTKEKVEFTSDLLYYKPDDNSKPHSLSKYPFFTTDIKYDINIINKLYSYDKIVRFFFDETYFKRKINLLFNTIQPKKEKYNNEIINNNIKVMMCLLLPITFPMNENYDNSFDKYIIGDNFSLSNIMDLNIPFKNFSYLKINNKVYTVTKILWLNDFFNHPIYRLFIDEYTKYKIWSKNQHIKLKEEVLKRISKIYKTENVNTSKDTSKDTSKGYYKINIGDIKTFILNNRIYYNDNNNEEDIKKIIKEKDDINKIKNDIIDKYYKEVPLYSRNASSYSIEKYETIKTIIYQLIEYYNMYQQNKTKNDENKTKNDNDNEKIEDFIKLYNIIEIIKNTEKKNINISGQLQDKIYKIYNDFKKIIINIKIYEEYINPENISINYKDDELVKDEIQKYQIYINFTKRINELISPVRISTNEKLQHIIQSYVDNENNDFIKLIEYINKKYILLEDSNSFDENTLNINMNLINIDEVNVPKYEAYIAIDLVEGEINDTNINDIYCEYKSLYLGNELEYYIGKYNKHEAKNNRIFFSLNDVINKKKDKSQKKTQEKIGGKRTIKKRYKYKKHSRKLLK
jgi:hypothetical protein